MTEGSSWASQKSRRGLKKERKQRQNFLSFLQPRRKERTLDVYGHDHAGGQARSAETEGPSSDLVGAQKEIFAVCVWSFCLWHWKAPLMDETREAERRPVCRWGGREGGEEESCEIYSTVAEFWSSYYLSKSVAFWRKDICCFGEIFYAQLFWGYFTEVTQWMEASYIATSFVSEFLDPAISLNELIK